MRACTVLLLLASACDQGSTRSELTILLIDGQADNPVVDVDEGELRVRVRQGEGDVQEATARIADGTFDLEVPITATTARTAIQARIDTSRGRVLLGAPPVFAPYGEGVGIARIVMGAPRPADRAPRVQLHRRLGQPRADGGRARRGRDERRRRGLPRSRRVGCGRARGGARGPAWKHKRVC
ncbi:MAG: hypothetical protein K8H88_03015, partial [Sandaracinaceae bacterium]|nr:hypothetical protein [Sandaracinaceae bacterium]